jgi:MFS transporter, ACS family, glucarate transporter
MRRVTKRTPIRIRWLIFGLMFLFPMLTYTQRTSINVAGEQLMPLFHLSQMQLGWMMWAYTLAYTILQVPAGILGERIGARAMFVIVGAVSFIATIATPVLPILLSGSALFAAWVLVQAILGASASPVSAVGSGVFEAWIPANQWGVCQGLGSSGPDLGIALTPPLIVALTMSFGWQGALLWVALPTALLTLVWGWYGRNTPREHPAVTPEELAELGTLATEPKPPLTLKRFKKILRNRNILLLSVSYLLFNYALYLLMNWSFLYLAQERHMSALAGGTLAAFPPIGAAVGAWIGGHLADRFAIRYGVRWGYRIVPLVTLPLVGMLLLLAMQAPNPYLAVAALTLAFAGVEANEGSYWAANMAIARADTMVAGGVLNTWGNLGGVVGIPIVAWLTSRGNWYGAFAVGTAFAIAAAVLWLLIKADRRLEEDTLVDNVADRESSFARDGLRSAEFEVRQRD